MGRISQAFTLAERFVGAYERYVDECTRRYRGMESEAAEAARNSERMTSSMEAKVSADEEMVPKLEDLATAIAGLVAQLATFNLGDQIDRLRVLLPNSVENGGEK